jgi:hypothetical protein
MMKNNGSELYCTFGIAAFIGGLFIFLFGLFSVPATSREVWIFVDRFDRETVCLVGGIIAIFGGAATTYGLILLRRNENSDRPTTQPDDNL